MHPRRKARSNPNPEIADGCGKIKKKQRRSVEKFMITLPYYTLKITMLPPHKLRRERRRFKRRELFLRTAKSVSLSPRVLIQIRRVIKCFGNFARAAKAREN